MSGTHVVFKHQKEDELAGYDSNYRSPEPEEVFSGSKEDCDRYVTRTYEDHDLSDPGPFGAPRPRLEVRVKKSTRYSDTDPV